MTRALPFTAVHFYGFGEFRVGADGVKQIGINAGMPGFLLVEVTLENDTIRRFQSGPATAVFECGDPIDVPDQAEAPKLVVPRSTI